MKKIAKLNVDKDAIRYYINSYRDNISKEDRYASFDYCYNYFQAFRKANNIKGIATIEHLEMSTLQLSNYLASWGMFRGSGGLLLHSSHVLIPVIECISNLDMKYWNIDVDNYSTRLDDLVYIYEKIRNSICFTKPKSKGNLSNVTVVLVTKILLGVFGNSPAMDEYFMTGACYSNANHIDASKSIKKVKKIWLGLADYYKENSDVINEYSIDTLSFLENDENFISSKYPKAKLIDMIFFEKGSN